MTASAARAPAPAGARPAAFGGVDRVPAPTAPPDFAALHASPEFTALRARFRRFTFPATALFLGWYLTYVLLAAYAPGLMSTRVSGAVTLGLLLGLGQFASTIALTAAYARWARRSLDPAAAAIRQSAGERG
ncbi:DUF485 domain-containing protein [Actinokineospora sp. G85]|uniref:DUF485 domain-containing protein n=1 Tax=Actinokineospora sp. G85 TaxID=3406626 RepID=UPI003C794D7C